MIIIIIVIITIAIIIILIIIIIIIIIVIIIIWRRVGRTRVIGSDNIFFQRKQAKSRAPVHIHNNNMAASRSDACYRL